VQESDWYVLLYTNILKPCAGSHHKRQLSTHHYLCRMTTYISFLNSFTECGMLLLTCCFM